MFDYVYLIQLSNLLISVEILGNYDTKTNQWVLTLKELNLALYDLLLNLDNPIPNHLWKMSTFMPSIKKSL